jgi:hypothetical protein
VVSENLESYSASGAGDSFGCWVDGGRDKRGRLQQWLGLRFSRGLCFCVHRC